MEMLSLKSQKVPSDDELGEMPNFDLGGAFLREAGLFENIDAETEITESSKNSEPKPNVNEPSKSSTRGIFSAPFRSR